MKSRIKRSSINTPGYLSRGVGIYHFKYRVGLLFFAVLFLVDMLSSGYARAAVLPENNVRNKDRDQDRPNILWLVSEDNSPETIGVYGYPAAYTPHIDSLASRGIVFRHAFSHSPVCAVARSALLSGMHSPSTGMHQMRSRIEQPQEIEDLFYPNLLRKAGYYTTNNSKTDYNLPAPHSRFWDESRDEAHYRNRAEGQPFFAVFNNHDPHESRMFLDVMANEPATDPAKVQLPPYHPDTPVMRRSWAHYFDLNTLMDTWVGDKLAELEESDWLRIRLSFIMEIMAVCCQGASASFIKPVPRFRSWCTSRKGGSIWHPRNPDHGVMNSSDLWIFRRHCSA